MYSHSFPNCCTMTILSGFGYGEAADVASDEDLTEKSIKEYIDLRTKFGHAAIVLSTNSTQHKANELLEKIGFKSSGWMEKRQHPNTKVMLWWYPLQK